MLEHLQDFHFIRPAWFLMLLPLAACIWLLINRRLGERNWERVCDRELLPYILIRHQGRGRKTFVTLFALAGLVSILALAGPAWERLPQPVFRSDTALVIIMDLSRSMDAPDVAPSRLERARFKIMDILENRGDGETALVVYAGDAFTVTPLTPDTETIKSQLPALTTSLMPLQGHRADLALELAGSLLKQAGHSRGHIILITDEIDPERDVRKAEKLNGQGYRISVLGVGTEEGAPVTLPNGGFLKTRSGEIVIPTLDHRTLKELASAGGGIYRSLQPGDADIRALLNIIDSDARVRAGAETEFTSDAWREQGPWLVLLLLPLAALAFRRGVILVLLCLVIPLPRSARALDWEGLWLNREQQAQRLMEQGRHEQAAKLFSDPEWRAAAQYRAGHYDEVLETLSDIDKPDSLYNRGNALARSGRYEEAIAMYDRVLEQVPEHEDARHNRDLLKKELEEQKQQAQQNSGGGGQKQPAGDEQNPSGDTPNPSPPEKDRQAGEPSRENPAGSEQDPEHGGDQEVSTADEKQQQGEEDRQQQTGRPGEESNEPAETSDKMLAGDRSSDREALATEQWLRRIPDDPGGLLREKFRLQYKQRGLSRHNYEQDW